MELREEIVRACLAEMRAKLEGATPQTRRDDDAAILLYSGIIKTFTAEPSLPAFR